MSQNNVAHGCLSGSSRLRTLCFHLLSGEPQACCEAEPKNEIVPPMSPENTSSRKRLVPSWRQIFFWPALVFVLVYFTHSLWMPLLVPLAIQRARQPGVSSSEKRREWEFVYRHALTANKPEELMKVATEVNAPGEIRGKAWSLLAEQAMQSGDRAKAGERYLSALNCLVSDPDLTGEGYGLRNRVWDQLRFQLGTVIDPQRYRAVLVSWVERTDDQRLLQQLVFELGKMKLLAKAEPASRAAEPNP